MPSDWDPSAYMHQSGCPSQSLTPFQISDLAVVSLQPTGRASGMYHQAMCMYLQVLKIGEWHRFWMCAWSCLWLRQPTPHIDHAFLPIPHWIPTHAPFQCKTHETSPHLSHHYAEHTHKDGQHPLAEAVSWPGPMLVSISCLQLQLQDVLRRSACAYEGPLHSPVPSMHPWETHSHRRQVVYGVPEGMWVRLGLVLLDFNERSRKNLQGPARSREVPWGLVRSCKASWDPEQSRDDGSIILTINYYISALTKPSCHSSHNDLPRHGQASIRILNIFEPI